MPYKVFNEDEAATYLHVPREVLDRLVKNQEIPCQVHAGRVVFTRYDIDAWASQRILRLSGENLDDYHRAASLGKSEPETLLIMPNLIQADWIAPDMASRTANGVLRDMVLVAERSEKVCDARQLLALLQEREQLCSTAVPGGLALLHPRHHTPFMFMDSFIAVGRAASGVPFGGPDGGLTDIFFLIGCGDDRAHLHILARLCAMCQKTGMLAAIRGADGARGIAAAILSAEGQLLKKG
ncbi:MAG: PTS sugar transporter subunit IIA [Kiritimatiellia bacterium]